MKTVLVCGAGTMGSGIAQVCASSGFDTILYELSPNTLQKAKESLRSTLLKLEEKGKIGAGEGEKILNRIRFSSVIEDCIADLVIEAIVEVPKIKGELFELLSRINSEKTIYASNTSSLSITALAKEFFHPEQMAGLHFFNPAPLMKLVEVVKAERTSEEVIEKLVDFTKKLQKTPVVCTDSPGFIVNRVARPYYIEALRLAEEGVDLKTIDELMQARGFKMGPFALMDLIGNDVNYAVSCSVYEQLGKPERLRPSDLQKERVEKRELGKKTGKGYYEY